MHICSVITSFTTGGAETLVCNLSRHFAQAGHETSIVALADAAAVGNSVDAEKQMMERLRADGISAVSLGLDAGRSMLKGRRALARHFASTQPDVVHLHTARAALMAGLAQPRGPLILTHHNSRLSFSKHLYKLFDQFVFAYVGISAACASQTRQYARRPVRLIANGAQVGNARKTPRTLGSRVPTIMAVGNISDQKDYSTLVAAAGLLVPRFQAQGKSFLLKIVGAGEQLSSLRDLVRTRGLDSHVHLLGTRNDVPELLRSADLFVNSSRYEGMSVATIEALMSALPVVATQVPGNTELIVHGENGLLVPPSDPGGLAAALSTALLDSTLYAKLSNAALRSSTAFTLAECASKHLDLYEEAIASTSTHRHAA
jgi:glycosyltransferase involved in cell wall biosynthesis